MSPMPRQSGRLQKRSSESVPASGDVVHPVQPARIPSLDGIRGVAIIVVLAAHTVGTSGLPVNEAVLSGFLFSGLLSVYVFFVLSGFLITRTLVTQTEERTILHLGRFLIRRFLRIQPSYLSFVLVVLGLGLMGFTSVPWSSALRALTYTRNYTAESVSFLGPAWTLAVEEQFYLLWALTLVFLGANKARKAAVVCIIIAPLLRGVTYLWLSVSESGLKNEAPHFFTSVMDIFAMGCLLGLVIDDDRVVRLLGRAQRIRCDLFAALLVVFMFLSPGGRGTGSHAGIGTVMLASASGVWATLVVHRYMTYPSLPLGRILNQKWAMTFGRLSYSLYLWHILFLNRYESGIVREFPINVVLAVCVSILMYLAVERPFLLIRERLDNRLFGSERNVVRGRRVRNR